jgi:hypothetical protein
MALEDPAIKTKVVNDFVLGMSGHVASSIDSRWDAMCENMQEVVEENIPVPDTAARVANKPWISAGTLALIELGDAARHSSNYDLELQLRKDIKKSAKRDRSRWLEDLASTGYWKALRKLKKPARFPNHDYGTNTASLSARI